VKKKEIKNKKDLLAHLLSNTFDLKSPDWNQDHQIIFQNSLKLLYDDVEYEWKSTDSRTIKIKFIHNKQAINEVFQFDKFGTVATCINSKSNLRI
jgi:hypothetical protein